MIKFTKFNKKLPPMEVDLLCSLGVGEALFTCVYTNEGLMIFNTPDLAWEVYLSEEDIDEEFYNETLSWVELEKVQSQLKF